MSVKWRDRPSVLSRGTGIGELYRSHQPERAPSCCEIAQVHWYLSHLSPPAKHLLHSKHQDTSVHNNSWKKNATSLTTFLSNLSVSQFVAFPRTTDISQHDGVTCTFLRHVYRVGSHFSKSVHNFFTQRRGSIQK